MDGSQSNSGAQLDEDEDPVVEPRLEDECGDAEERVGEPGVEDESAQEEEDEQQHRDEDDVAEAGGTSFGGQVPDTWASELGVVAPAATPAATTTAEMGQQSPELGSSAGVVFRAGGAKELKTGSRCTSRSRKRG